MTATTTNQQASQHTPGPWLAQPDRLGREHARWWVHDEDFGDIALVLRPVVAESLEAPEAEANARLIAAAPELLEIVCFLGEWFKQGTAPLDGSTLMDDERTVREAVAVVLARVEG